MKNDLLKRCFRCKSQNLATQTEKRGEGFDVNIIFCRDCNTMQRTTAAGEYMELNKKYQESVGYEIIKIIHELNIYKESSNMNYNDLIDIIMKYENNLQEFWGRNTNERRNNFNTFKIHFLRHLLNYMAIARALIEKSRGWNNHLAKKPGKKFLKDKYDKKLIELNIKEQADFLGDIRNNLLHKLDISEIENVELRIEEVSKILKGKILIGEQKKDIKEFLLNYHETVTKFHRWFVENICTIFFDQIKELDLIDKRRKEISKGFQHTGITLTDKDVTELKGRRSLI